MLSRAILAILLIDFTDDAFSHGHAYVAFSRARFFNMVRIIVREDKIIEVPDIQPNGDAHNTKMVPAVVNTVVALVPFSVPFYRVVLVSF